MDKVKEEMIRAEERGEFEDWREKPEEKFISQRVVQEILLEHHSDCEFFSTRCFEAIKKELKRRC